MFLFDGQRSFLPVELPGNLVNILPPDSNPLKMTDPMLPDSYSTLAQPAEVETKVQRSRFIALASNAQDEESAKLFIAQVRKRFYDSRHVCHGWQLGLDPNTVENRNDDGEPSGTAGEPILMAIRRSGLSNVVVAVVRYFGGIKLGTGGLARAYGGAADLVLEADPAREVLLGREFDLRFPYPRRKTVHHLLEQHRGKVVKEEYGEGIDWRIWLPHSTWQGFLGALTEVTAGELAAQPVAEAQGKV